LDFPPEVDIRERGSFEPLVSEELFARVQDVLEGRRVALSTHTRDNPEFPLRVFVSCAKCNTPLTGSLSKGRKKHYPYYHCRNARCKAVYIRKEKLEMEFGEFIRSLSPEGRYMRLFREVVTQVWKQRQAASESHLRASQALLNALGDRKKRLVDFFLDGKLDQQTYDEQAERLKTEIEAARREMNAADLECVDVEAVLDFAEKLVEMPHMLWLRSSGEQKLRLQSVFFPEGVVYGNEGFGTTASNSLFNVLQDISAVESHVASPTGFEPVLPP